MRTCRAPAVVGMLAALATTNCSLMLSKPPPQRPMATFDDCSASTLPVWFDGYWVATSASFALVGFGGAALRYSQAKDDTQPSWDARPDTSAMSTLLAIGGISTAVTIALIQSARYGVRSSEACQAARAELLTRPPFYVEPPAAGP
jgi:hypothetical protein